MRQKGIVELAREVAAISAKARTKGLTLAEMSGGCFSISSLGAIGGTAFTPIINAPEVAILGVATAWKPQRKDDAIDWRLMLPLSLSYDHRVINGAEAARFLDTWPRCSPSRSGWSSEEGLPAAPYRASSRIRSAACQAIAITGPLGHRRRRYLGFLRMCSHIIRIPFVKANDRYANSRTVLWVASRRLKCSVV